MPERSSRKTAPAGGVHPCCELRCFNVRLVDRLRRHLPDADSVARAETFFAALGNRTRLLILHCLAGADELCVCDVANALKMNLSTVSHQLRHLRELGLVTFRSEGKMAFYRLSDDRVAALVAAQFDRAADKVKASRV